MKRLTFIIAFCGVAFFALHNFPTDVASEHPQRNATSTKSFIAATETQSSKHNIRPATNVSQSTKLLFESSLSLPDSEARNSRYSNPIAWRTSETMARIERMISLSAEQREKLAAYYQSTYGESNPSLPFVGVGIDENEALIRILGAELATKLHQLSRAEEENGEFSEQQDLIEDKLFSDALTLGLNEEQTKALRAALQTAYADYQMDVDKEEKERQMKEMLRGAFTPEQLEQYFTRGAEGEENLANYMPVADDVLRISRLFGLNDKQQSALRDAFMEVESELDAYVKDALPDEARLIDSVDLIGDANLSLEQALAFKRVAEFRLAQRKAIISDKLASILVAAPKSVPG